MLNQTLLSVVGQRLDLYKVNDLQLQGMIQWLAIEQVLNLSPSPIYFVKCEYRDHGTKQESPLRI